MVDESMILLQQHVEVLTPIEKKKKFSSPDCNANPNADFCVCKQACADYPDLEGECMDFCLECTENNLLLDECLEICALDPNQPGCPS